MRGSSRAAKVSNVGHPIMKSKGVLGTTRKSIETIRSANETGTPETAPIHGYVSPLATVICWDVGDGVRESSSESRIDIKLGIDPESRSACASLE